MSGTLGILLIGDEILSGSIRERNSDYIIQAFSPIGYQVEEMRVIPDSRSRIADCFAELAPRFDVLISTGGIGPTHDDVTLESAAAGFNVPLVLDSRLSEFLERHYGTSMNESLRRMAMVPDGAIVDQVEVGGSWPLIRYANTFILPGLPRAMQDKVDRIVASLPAEERFVLGEVFLSADESDYVDWLNAFQERHGTLSVGSYPYWNVPEYKTRIAVRSRDGQAVRNATDEVVRFAKEHDWLVRWNLSE